MLVAPSILACNFAVLGEEIAMLNRSEADMLHVDVMDGMFVPNISIGFPEIKIVGRLAEKPLDVHMMVMDPSRFVKDVSECGASLMNVHYEACRHLDRTIRDIHAAGMKAGVTINPATPVEMLTDVIAEVELVLIMSVNPGFGGQPFIENSIDKVRRLRRLIADRGSNALIEVDGGVTESTGRRLAEAGADILVAGSYVFKSADPEKAIIDLKSL